MDKPRYAEGQPVAFDFGNGTSGTGKIRGLAFSHLVDGWIVEVEDFTGIDPIAYPWSCIVVTHPQLKPVENTRAPLSVRPTWQARPDLYECEKCSSLPGTPTLCMKCLAARNKAGPHWVGPRNLSPESAVICSEAHCGATMQAKGDGSYACPQCQATRQP
jgi:hypothetical protein